MFQNAIIYLFFISQFASAFCQSKSLHRIHFKDKDLSPFSIEKSSEFLSQQALNRRAKYKIEIDLYDLPISKTYLDSIKKTGVEIISSSKWLNTIIIATEDSLALSKISNYSFVEDSKSLGKSTKRSKTENKLEFSQDYNLDELSRFYSNKDYGYSHHQIKMLNGDYLHQIGYKGKGLKIAILDAGFYRANSLAAFSQLFLNEQILGTKNFVNQTDVYQNNSHGMNVLSVIGGNLKEKLIGTAPEASFWLIQSEDVDYEYIAEEDFWVAAAEFADSVGVDIIQSSLGYTTFDNSEQNHSYQDLNGNTTIAAKGANIAAKKGILVICSAGNSGASPWKYIGTPADADNVLAIGAVNADSSYANFSSVGFTNTLKIKPNITAQGRTCIVAASQGGIQKASGTSFSAPIISGLAACLWQAFPEKTNMEIFEVIEQSASRYENPDNLLGFGLPNFYNAYRKLIQNKDYSLNESLEIFPNPFSNEINIFIQCALEEEIEFELFDFLGKSYFIKKISLLEKDSKILNINDLEYLDSGLYFLKIKAFGKTFTHKMVKHTTF